MLVWSEVADTIVVVARLIVGAVAVRVVQGVSQTPVVGTAVWVEEASTPGRDGESMTTPMRLKRDRGVKTMMVSLLLIG